MKCCHKNKTARRILQALSIRVIFYFLAKLYANRNKIVKYDFLVDVSEHCYKYLKGKILLPHFNKRVLKEIFKEESELVKRSVKYQHVDEKEKIKEKVR